MIRRVQRSTVVLALVGAFVLGCSGRAAPATTTTAATTTPPAEPAAEPAPPRGPLDFPWPDTLELEVESSFEQENSRGKRERGRSRYWLEYARLRDGSHRFWEGGPLEWGDSLDQRVVKEVGAFRSLFLPAH